MSVLDLPSPGAAGPHYQVGPMTRTDFVRYAGAGGDFNPIHHDEMFAQNAGYPSVFGHGLLTAGILGGYVTEWLGIERVTRFSVRYVAQVWPGDILNCCAVVDAVNPTEHGHDVVCTLTVERKSASGEVQTVLTGSATAFFKGQIA